MAFRSEDVKAVSSRQNPWVEAFRDLQQDLPERLVFIEGPKLLEEALKSALRIEKLAFIPARLEDPLVQQACAVAEDKIQITPYVLKALSDVDAPQGVVAIVRKPHTDWSSLLGAKTAAPDAARWLILDGIQDPGNAGTILRTAEAAGVLGIVTTPGTARLFGAKALRASAGSALRLPALEHRDVGEIVERMTSAGVRLVATGSEGTDFRAFDWHPPLALILGSEGAGLSADWSDRVAARVTVPMKPPVESLNVAVSAAVLLYEASRPR